MKAQKTIRSERWRNRLTAIGLHVNNEWILISVSILLFATLCLLWYVWLFYGARAALAVATEGDTWGGLSLGTLGDMFGGLNAFLTSLTVLGLFVASILQYRVLIETRSAAQAAKEATARAQFRSDYSRLFDRFECLQDRVSHQRKKGRRAIAELARELRDRIDAPEFHARGRPPAEDSTFADQRGFKLAAAIERLEGLRHKNESGIGELIDTLLRMLVLIDSSEMSDDEKRNYFGMLKLSLTKDMLTVLGIGALSLDSGEFKMVIQRYGILEGLRVTWISDQTLRVLYEAYDWMAFASNEEREASGPPRWEPAAYINKEMAPGGYREYAKFLRNSPGGW